MQPLLQWKTNTYYVFRDCEFVAIGIQHAKRMRQTVIRGLPSSTNFSPHFLINGKIFERKKKVTDIKYEL